MLFGLFDDSKTSNFYPLTYSRSFSRLRTGPLTPEEEVRLMVGNRFWGIRSHQHLNTYYQHTNNPVVLHAEKILFINSRLRNITSGFSQFSSLVNHGDAFISGDSVAAVVIDSKFEKDFIDHSDAAAFVSNPQESSFRFFEHTWEVILDAGDTINQQQELILRSGNYTNQSDVYKPFILGDHPLYLANSVTIHPLVAFDLRKGPVFIDNGTEIFSHSTISGPAFIGQGTKIKAGSKIYPNTIIGPVCKVGGEIEDVIIQGYSNKQHEGFLGHSFIGEWCNLGADTNNSDLKNTYAPVEIWENGKQVQTGSQFMGTIMGDHSKTGINTMLNTGTVIGFSSMVAGAGFPERLIPSFHWSIDGRLLPYRMNKAIETATAVMKRRNIQFSDADRVLFEEIKKISTIEISRPAGGS